MKIRVIAGAKHSDGIPMLCAFMVECTKAQYDNGDHYSEVENAIMMEYPETSEPVFMVDEDDQPNAFTCFDDLPAYTATC